MHFTPNTEQESRQSLQLYLKKVICPCTTPNTILTDNGPEFNNAILAEICRIFNIKKINVDAYKPESNGVVERLNRKVITCLRTLSNPNSITWDTRIPHVTCRLNTQINSATGEMPHYILFGKDKNLPYSLLESDLRQVYNYDDFILTRINKFKQIYQRIKDHMKQFSQDLTKQQNKSARDIKLQAGDIIMVKLHTSLGNNNKLSPKFKGPYIIVARGRGKKFKIRHFETSASVRHADELRQTKMNEFGEHTLVDSEETDNTETQTDKTQTETNHVETGTDSAQSGKSHCIRKRKP